MPRQHVDFDSEHGAAEEAESDEFDFEKVKEWVGFVVRAARRRPTLAIVTFVIVASFGLAAAATMPRSYYSDVKILAQKTGAIRALSSSNQEMVRVDDPTKNVANMIMRRDNIEALVRQAHLADRFEEARSPALRLKDRFAAWMNGPYSDDDKLRVMVGFLEQRLGVYTDDNTLIIGVDWPTPRMAYDLVTLVQKNFLEARYDSDLAAINDSIAVLQDHARGELANVDTSLAEYQRVVAANMPAPVGRLAALQTYGRGSRRPVAEGAADSKGAGPDPSSALALEETRLRVRALEAERQRLLETLKQQLAQAQLTLTPMHPTVIALQQRIDAMSEPSAELVQLKSDERTLMSQIAAQSAAPDPLPQTRVLRDPLPPSAVPPPLPSATPLQRAGEDGTTRVARSKLESAIQGYETAMARIDAANIELEITRAAYKHRYTVLTPAEVPGKPTKPLAQLVGVGSIVAAAVLAFLIAALADLAGGKVLETWQVRRRLKLDVIGELDRHA